MSTTINPEETRAGQAPASGPTTDQVWRHLAKASFAVIGHVTPAGEPRSSGVVYAVLGRRTWSPPSTVGRRGT
jgi:hypothetical protein